MEHKGYRMKTKTGHNPLHVALTSVYGCIVWRRHGKNAVYTMLHQTTCMTLLNYNIFNVINVTKVKKIKNTSGKSIDKKISLPNDRLSVLKNLIFGLHWTA